MKAAIYAPDGTLLWRGAMDAPIPWRWINEGPWCMAWDEGDDLPDYDGQVTS